jgi:lipopolysaccharide transport system ATP-binding protein
LRAVSFDLREGEVLGVIGHNGAGKSTLLKILCRITEPTCGTARIRGRVGSLLEVGTGFHPELTGRENTYLNGAILGMGRLEIDRKFDEIVDFSGVERFIDTPVKHYSSGMYLRLAFAVAAHLEPEVLLIDEVLAVGDAAFQKKCLEKMGDTAQRGRTIVFVSHNLSAVMRLCPRALLLQEGRIVASGPSEVVVDRYLHSEATATGEKIWANGVSDGVISGFRPQSVRLRDRSGAVTDAFLSREAIDVEIEYEVTEALQDLRVGIYLQSGLGEMLFISFDRDDPGRHAKHLTRSPGRYVSKTRIPANLLNRGAHILGVSAALPRAGCHFLDQYALRFEVDVTGGVGDHWRAPRTGYIRPGLDWNIETAPGGSPR